MVTSLCRDENCPRCGYPETYAEVDLSAATPGVDELLQRHGAGQR